MCGIRLHCCLTFATVWMLVGVGCNPPPPRKLLKPKQPKIGLGYYTPAPLGEPIEGRPWVTDLRIVDFDQDGRLDILFCEGNLNEVRWLRQEAPGVFAEQLIASEIAGPVSVAAEDLDQDGDLDLMIGSMGVVFPNTQLIGAVVVLEQTANGEFERHTLLADTHRVVDITAGDLDGDGDYDLAVAQFGYDQGEVIWMENRGDWQFTPHPLLSLSGAIHTPIADLNGDGFPDIATVVSQEWEEVYVFANDGAGSFTGDSVYGSTNEDYGSSGITLADLDQDGDQDILYTNGDAFDYTRPGPRPWHGVQWLENDGRGNFRFHRLGDFAGAYSPWAADVDGDGDLDIVAVSGFNHWEDPEALSLVCFENDGKQSFTKRPLAKTPTHLIVVEGADLDGDGVIELVTGSFHAYPPYDRIGRITLWDR